MAVAGRTRAAYTRLCVDEAGQLLSSGTVGTLSLVTGEGAHDGMLEQWFGSEAEMREAAADLAASADWEALQRDTARTERALLNEHVVVKLPDASLSSTH